MHYILYILNPQIKKKILREEMNQKKKKKWRTQTTKAPSAVVSAINPTPELRLTSAWPITPPIITSLFDLTIPCSSVTNGNHHEICAPPRGWGWVGEWIEWGWGWLGETMRGGWNESESESQWGWGKRGGWVEREMREMSFRIRVVIYIYVYR